MKIQRVTCTIPTRKLSGATVSYDLPRVGGGRLQGRGTIAVLKGLERGKVRIFVENDWSTPTRTIHLRHELSQSQADRIEEINDGEGVGFRLILN